MTIKEKISELRASLPHHVELVAVSKTKPVEAIAEAYQGGQRHFGESRPQELCTKYEALPKDIVWHQIGHLQTNKVRSIAPFVAMIQSVDSERLAKTIDQEAQRVNRTIDILFEIHIAQEQSKHGWSYDELTEWLDGEQWRTMSGIRPRGVMTIATLSDDKKLIESEFDTMRQIFTELQRRYFDASFDTISMGMSGDYPTAINHGSTMIRVGSALFEPRHYTK